MIFVTNREGINARCNLSYIELIKNKVSHKEAFKDVVTPYTHISEASRYILYTIILTFDGICTIS